MAFGLGWLFGENFFTVPMKDATHLLNLCMEYGIVYRRLRTTDDERVGFFCSSYSSAALRRLCERKGIDLTLVSSRGLPSLIYSYRRRFGMLIGVVMAVFIISLSDDYIWDVRVSGNETLTYSHIVSALEEQGFGVGTPIDGLNVDRLKTAVMVKDDRISWMAVNVVGTVAYVQIRERVAPEPDRPLLPANIVAERDGEIQSLEIFRGDAAVKVGQAVRKGEILISGVRESNVDGFSVTRAAGSVFAVTEREIRVEIPYEYEKKTYSDSRKSEISVIFFGKDIKVLKNTGNCSEFCDTIESEKMLELPGGVRLPFGIKSVMRAEYTVSTEKYTQREAMELAYYRLGQRLAAELAEAQILSKSIEAEIGESSYVLICRIKCIEDIGRVSEFETDLS